MNSSSGDSVAPLDFHVSSSSGEDNIKLGVATEECPLCCKAKRNFYCKCCIRNGNFLHSSPQCSETFIDKKLKLLSYRQEKAKAQITLENSLTPHMKKNQTQSDIKTINERILFLKLLIQDKKMLIVEKKERLKNLTEINAEKKKRLPRYGDRVGQLKEYVEKKTNDLKDQEANLKNINSTLMKIRKRNINQLVEYIFPITIVKPSGCHEEDSDTVSALEDACRTAYVQGKWVFTNVSTELQHSIVAPTLPSSGDYSAYNDWVAANKDGVPSSTNTIDFNPAYNISAALTYTTQLVNMLAYYLDVRLPSKLCYSEFCSSELSKDKFTKRVARLNWNIIHLCLSQNVNPSLLRAESTLANILCLLQATELGRTGACEIDPEATLVLEETLKSDLEICSESEDSEDDSEHLSYEWEAVANVGIPEIEAGQNLTSQQLSSSSVAGGLLTSTAASIVSLWRGWATNR